MLAERVGGASLGDLLRERFFEPLGLDGTFYQPTETARGPVAHGYRFATTAIDAKPIDLMADGPNIPFTSVVSAARGAGALAATSSDVARWARALYGGGVLEDVSLQEMLDDIARTEPYSPTVPYGLGVQATTIDGQAALGHSGPAARLPLGDALPARVGHHHRGADQPEPDRSGGRRPGAAQHRPDAEPGVRLPRPTLSRHPWCGAAPPPARP